MVTTIQRVSMYLKHTLITLTRSVVDFVKMLSNAHDQVAFLAGKTNTGRRGIQFDHTHESIGLVPDPHGAINTA